MTVSSGVPDNDVFCVLPWTHLCGTVDGVWGRCCVDTSVYHDDLYRQPEQPAFTLHPDALGCLPTSRFGSANPDRALTAEAAFNSDNMRRTRLTMLAGEKVAACSYCYEREAAGGESYRQKATAMVADDADIGALVAATTEDGSLDAFPIYFDLRFGNSCNLKCIMCGYPVSSRWGLDQHPKWAPAHVDPYRDADELWETLREHAGQLRRIYFAGGEPMMQPGHFRLLDLLIDSGSAGLVNIAYNSNLTILPDGIFDKLAHFRSVGIGASCDGTGEIFERIRVGAKWPEFAANVRTARQHVKLWLQVAPQRDNVFHLRDIVDFARAEGVSADLSNFVHWPAELSVGNMPQEQRAEADRYLADLADDCRGWGLVEEAQHLEMLRAFVLPPATP